MNPQVRRGRKKLVGLEGRRVVSTSRSSKLAVRYLQGSAAILVAFLALFNPAEAVAQNREVISPDEVSKRLQGKDAAAPVRQTLEVGTLKGQALSASAAKVEAGRILKALILTGGSYEATHVMTYARLTSDHELVAPIRQRLAKSDTSWGEQHVKLGAMHALVVLENEKFPSEISSFLRSDDVSLKVRAFMLVRDSGDASLASVVQEELASEEDASVKAAGLSALAVLEAPNSPSKVELQAMAASDAQIGSRARIELSESGVDPPSSEATLSRENEEKFKQMTVSGQHDERMYAIEELAKHGSEGARGWLRRLGEKEDWRVRMTSAYYLLLAGEKQEAQKRLQTETQPLVQITLLATLRTEGAAQ